MNISKAIQKCVTDCDKDLLKDCTKCKGCDEWNHFEYYELVSHARKERIWYCPKCVMIGNIVEFKARGLEMECNRCGTIAEEIRLE
jgi:hypothetical protein